MNNIISIGGLEGLLTITNSFILLAFVLIINLRRRVRRIENLASVKDFLKHDKRKKTK